MPAEMGEVCYGPTIWYFAPVVVVVGVVGRCWPNNTRSRRSPAIEMLGRRSCSHHQVHACGRVRQRDPTGHRPGLPKRSRLRFRYHHQAQQRLRSERTPASASIAPVRRWAEQEGSLFNSPSVPSGSNPRIRGHMTKTTSEFLLRSPVFNCAICRNKRGYGEGHSRTCPGV